MIHDLAESFLPSLCALLFTVLIAIFYGHYIHKASELGRTLDLFVSENLFWTFRPRSVGSQLEGVQETIAKLVERLDQRDEGFLHAAKALGDVVGDLGKIGPDVKAAGDRISSAAEKMAEDSTNLIADLGKQIGKDSPLEQSIDGFRQSTIKQAKAAKEMQKNCKLLSDAAEKSVSSLESGLELLPEEIKRGCKKGATDVANSLESTTKAAIKPLESATGAMQMAILDLPTKVEQGCEKGSKVLLQASEVGAKNLGKAAAEAEATFERGAEEVSQKLRAAATDAEETILGPMLAIDEAAENIKQSGDKLESAVNEKLESLGKDHSKRWDRIDEKLDKKLEELSGHISETEVAAKKAAGLTDEVLSKFQGFKVKKSVVYRMWTATKSKLGF